VCLDRLAKMGVTSVLLEGGSEVNAAALEIGAVKKIMLYMAPRLLGGRDAINLVGGRCPLKLAGAVPIRNMTIQRVGQDYLLTGSLSTSRTK
jgi:diaminohydroxyphosphoribosylaminopyrimidine deaminase/5-amino-6-(5-phosphoribosylamino)uracil reductase